MQIQSWAHDKGHLLVKFVFSEKAAKFCEIFALLLTTVHTVKSKVKISQNFVAFSEYMNFKGAYLLDYLVQKKLAFSEYMNFTENSLIYKNCLQIL